MRILHVLNHTLARRSVVLSLAVLTLLIGSFWLVKVIPVPWHGTEDKSCARYKKTRFYDIDSIDNHLTHVLDADNSPTTFYRWEGPVRYYLETPPEYPELVKLFDEQLAQVGKHTGLDIARHDKPYLPYKEDKLNEESKWPEGLSTNAMVIFTKDFKTTLETQEITQILDAMNWPVERELAAWNDMKKQKPGQDSYGRIVYGYNPDGIAFMLQILESNFSAYADLRAKSNVFSKHSFFNAMSFATKLNDGSKFLPSILNKNFYALTDIDEQFLKALYSKNIQSGMPLIRAKQVMFRKLYDCFNAKP